MATSTQASPETGPAQQGAAPPKVVTRKRRRIAVGLLVFAIVMTALGALLIGAAYKNDGTIDAHTGRGEAEVISVQLRRTLIVFTTPDGMVHTPPNGVLYPTGLKPGNTVRVEYDRNDPELVRVAGRHASLALLPVGTTLLAVWVVSLAGRWWYLRPRAL
jgi:hypothetical protein